MAARRTFLKISALLILLGLAALVIFVATFDLNRYRALVEKGLSGALDRPVEIAAARLSVRHGLAIDLSGLHIGATRPGESELDAEHLFLKLDLPELLSGRIDIEEVILGRPRLQLTLSPQETKAPPSPPPAIPERLRDARLGSLRVIRGVVRIEDRRRPQQQRTITLREIEGHLEGIALNSRSSLRFSAELIQPRQTAALVEGRGAVEVPADPRQWRSADLDLALTVKDLRPDALLDLFTETGPGAKLTGQGTLGGRIAGSPAEGLRFAAELGGGDLALHLPDTYRSPLSLPDISLAGLWSLTEEGQRISDLKLNAEALTLQGSLRVEEGDGGHRLEGELSSPPLPLIELARFIPGGRGAGLDDLLRKRLSGGTLQIESLHFSGPLPGAISLQSARARISEGGLHVPEIEEEARFETALALREGRLEVEEAVLQVAGGKLHLSGSVIPEEESTDISLEAYGTLPSEKLLTLLPQIEQVEIDAAGPLPISLELSGVPERLVIDLKVDLKHLAFNLESKLRKPAGLEARLFATAELTPQRLEVNHGLLSVPPMELRGRGSLERATGHPFVIELDLAPLDMQQARFRTPLLDRFEPRGQIAARYRLSGTQGRLQEHGGSLLLRGFGMRIPGPVADLDGADGEIEIEGGSAQISRLSARIGSSPVTVEGRMETDGELRFDLRVRSPSIRASDLIFPNPEKVFRDVDGHLVITRQGISFSPVKVRLGDDTAATVRGNLTDFKAPEVRLDIAAERADIMEIIGLWKRPPGWKPQKKQKRKVDVLIEARVDDGEIGPLRFQDGRGTIATRGDQLVIFPLRFQAGKGSCTGQVVVDRSGAPPALLRISGHLNNFSAARLQSELLKKRGLITGTLNGDFYLEGRVGPTFLPTSLGGVSVRIKDGVLRKFSVLSRVFSLLNVSQLFEFNLPDMDEQGMPFERLSASFGLRQGILATEDLFVKSNAMNLSLVGQTDLVKGELDFVLGVKPLRTVDKIVTQIPIAGWLLTGDEKALLTAHFLIGGETDDPEVMAIPITSVSDKAIGIFRRVFSLPGKLITDPEEVFKGSD